ncbi:MAG: DUF418 domain-containing protein [Flavobacteriaceae bacterium]|nr:DUF418 domain-containing protein [Bacteroidia bacterium]MBT8288619.1 DUF418 domain-containing protein [Bacteroidia bacterium]NNF74465.1 DUF418 domain-containing protein [Flavobacteriaceae bacterium]NNK74350.1 DUF418 domain-containing protein [Flavobacteriaceae bacterium]NNL80231.1 DUF418 domain-containing protein [Flavobacteriaceae bacterium]
MSPFHNQPTTAGERIQALDVLRGFAILGILIMNIQSFSMPGAAYLNPMAYGDVTGINKWVWILSHLFADQKFMTIFSVLFGAGIILMTKRAKDRSGHSAGLHYRRTFWLLVIGLVHAHLIWYGDILVPYAICALFVYLFRNLRPYHLMIIGFILIAVHTLIYGFFGFSLDMWPQESLDMARQSWLPSMESMQEEIAALTGSLSEQIGHNSSGALFLETAVFLMIFLWRAAGLMLIGMAMFKAGVLTAEKSKGYYVRGLIFCVAIGLMVSGYGIYVNYKADFSFEYSMYLGSQWNYWGSLFTAFGYICAVMLIAKTDALPWLRDRLAAVGRMALTNYLTQSIICVFIFWGIGLGLFGTFDRWQQLLVVLGVWVIQILWSKPWLNNFAFGPFEWLWRSLTYMKRQPFRNSELVAKAR